MLQTNHGSNLNTLLKGCNLNRAERLIFHLVLTYRSGHKSMSLQILCDTTKTALALAYPTENKYACVPENISHKERNPINCISDQHCTRRLYHQTPQLCFKHLDQHSYEGKSAQYSTPTHGQLVPFRAKPYKHCSVLAHGMLQTNHGSNLNTPLKDLKGCNLNMAERLIFHLVLTYRSGHKSMSLQILCDTTRTALALAYPTENKYARVPENISHKERNPINCISPQHCTRRLYHETPQLCFKHLDLHSYEGKPGQYSKLTRLQCVPVRAKPYKHCSVLAPGMLQTNHGSNLNTLLKGCNLNRAERLIFHLVLTYRSGHKSMSLQILCDTTKTALALAYPTENKYACVPENISHKERNPINCISDQHCTRRLYHQTPQLCFKHLDQHSYEGKSAQYSTPTHGQLVPFRAKPYKHCSVLAHGMLQTNHGSNLNTPLKDLKGCNLNMAERLIFHLVLTYRSGHKSMSLQNWMFQCKLEATHVIGQNC